MSIPWTIKHRPKKVSEVVGNDKAKETFLAWLKSWSPKSKNKAALLYGPPGVGKTSLVYATANELGYEVVEANASDVRTSQALKRRIFRAATERALFSSKGKIILLDEVDGISLKEDKGGIDAIIELMSISRHPIVLTANDPWDPRLKSLRSLCLLIEFRPLKKREVISALKRICEKEGINVAYDVLKALAERAKGDLRAAINDLQAIAEGKSRVSVEDLNLLGARYKQVNYFEMTRQILVANRIEQARAVLATPSLDYEMLFLYISENIPYQYDNIEAIAEAYDALSRADMYMGRIKRKQAWGLLPYALNMLTAGVAVIKHKPKFKWTKYSFPERLKLMAKMREKRDVRKAILTSIAKKCHVSRRIANTEILPFIKFIYEVDKNKGKKILRWLRISENNFKLIISKLNY